MIRNLLTLSIILVCICIADTYRMRYAYSRLPGVPVEVAVPTTIVFKQGDRLLLFKNSMRRIVTAMLQQFQLLDPMIISNLESKHVDESVKLILKLSALNVSLSVKRLGTDPQYHLFSNPKLNTILAIVNGLK